MSLSLWTTRGSQVAHTRKHGPQAAPASPLQGLPRGVFQAESGQSQGLMERP